jgi:ABC-type amino acid transport substrate-binding protein
MENRRGWRWLALALLVLGALTFAACGDDDDDGTDTGDGQAQQFPAGSTLAEIQDSGEIKIGVKFDVPPFGFENPQTGDVEGFDVDLGKAIADELGVEPNYIEAISDNRIPFLEDGTVDVILSTMTITEERDLEIDFSEVYFIARGRVLVPGGSDIGGIEDLGSGDRVCTALGSTYADTIAEDAPEADLRLVDDYSACLELLQNGAVDAVSTDDIILTGMIIQDDSLRMVGRSFTTEPYGIGIPEGDRQLKGFVDEVLADYKEDGRWDAAYEKWVGQYTGVEQEPPTMTLEEAIRLAPLE